MRNPRRPPASNASPVPSPPPSSGGIPTPRPPRRRTVLVGGGGRGIGGLDRTFRRLFVLLAFLIAVDLAALLASFGHGEEQGVGPKEVGDLVRFKRGSIARGDGGGDGGADSTEGGGPPASSSTAGGDVGDGAAASEEDERQSERLLEMLRRAGLDLSEGDRSELPRWSDVASMYGSEPIIVGLDTCERFQTEIPPPEAYIGPAGTFNSGTNLMAELLIANCALPEKQKKYGPQRAGMRWQVPWGKHPPVSQRLHNVGENEKKVVQEHVLPVVTIKDPYFWMGSMCRHRYSASWQHTSHCPNLVPSDADRGQGIKGNNEDGGIPVTVKYKDTIVTEHNSLVGHWNDWYGDYQAVTSFPRLIVRVEDLIFHPEYVTKAVCECGGGKLLYDTVKLIGDSAKQGGGAVHKGSSGLLSAMARYGNPEKRLDGMTEDDLNFAEKYLRKDLMEIYGYKLPPR